MAQTYEDKPTLAAWNAVESSIVCGTYTGDGTLNRVISLGFTPRAIFVFCRGGIPEGGSSYINMGLALPNAPVYSNRDYPALAVVNGGFQVSYHTGPKAATNNQGYFYHYVALR